MASARRVSPSPPITQLTCEQLLRLKCAAYSTLNESDEDTVAEARLMEKAGEASALVAPAALYLTAILECVPAPFICGH